MNKEEIILLGSLGAAVGLYGLYKIFSSGDEEMSKSERNAIMNVKDKNMLSSSKIVIVRLNDGNIVPAKPCEMCKRLLNKYKLGKVCTLYEDKITHCF